MGCVWGRRIGRNRMARNAAVALGNTHSTSTHTLVLPSLRTLAQKEEVCLYLISVVGKPPCYSQHNKYGYPSYQLTLGTPLTSVQADEKNLSCMPLPV